MKKHWHSFPLYADIVFLYKHISLSFLGLYKLCINSLCEIREAVISLKTSAAVTFRNLEKQAHHLLFAGSLQLSSFLILKSESYPHKSVQGRTGHFKQLIW